MASADPSDPVPPRCQGGGPDRPDGARGLPG